MAFYYGEVVTIAAVIHVFMGVAWIGTYITIELVVLRDLKAAKRLQDLATFKNHAPRLSKIAIILGLLTLVTGLTYFLLKFGTDLGFLLGFPESRTILVALGVVTFLLLFALFVLKPRAQGIGKSAASLKPDEPLPADFLARVGQLSKLVRVQGAGLFLTLTLMVIATQGGI